MGKVKIIGHSLFCMCFYAHGKVLQAVPGRGSHPGLFSMGLAIMLTPPLTCCTIPGGGSSPLPDMQHHLRGGVRPKMISGKNPGIPEFLLRKPGYYPVFLRLRI